MHPGVEFLDKNHKISVWSPGTGVKGGGELPDTGSGTWTGSSSETVCLINHCNTKRLKNFKKKKCLIFMIQ